MVVLGSKLGAQLEQGSSISLPSGKTEERDHTASKLAFASSLLESLQDKQNGFLCLQVRSRRVLTTFFFFFFYYFHFRTQFAVEPIQTLLGKKGTSSGSCWIALMGLGIMLTALPGRSVTLHQVVNA